MQFLCKLCQKNKYNGERLTVFPKTGKKVKDGHSHHFNAVLYRNVCLVSVTGQEKVIKSIHPGKKEVKLSLFTDNTLLYKENPL